MKRILILSANPKDTNKLRLDEEARKIQEALKLSKNRDKFEIFVEWAVRVEDLRRSLLDHQPNIVHFSGHGVGSDGLAFEDNSGITQLVCSEALASIFELFRGTVECIFLNACYSEVQAQAIHQHINCVIGMNQSVGDVAAIEFATGFYDALGALESYDYAFRMGQASIHLKGSVEYLTPVLKSRPSSVFSKNSMEASGKSAKSSQPRYSGKLSQNISRSIVYGGGGMQAAQGNNNQQRMSTVSTASGNEKQLTQEEVIELLVQIEQLIQKAKELPAATKEKSLKYLGAAKEEAEFIEPDKQLVSGNLKRMAEILRNASETVITTKSLWEYVKLILVELSAWLSVAKTFFGFL
ncbi:CHAT domain-containing protein [Scytonema sp. NUACC26]|uniref:CHAT domain-containing protein n=1 Tax=Scytonema sp. NUACC26 TaxID=3140176 RepID=UPI0034DCAABC